MAFQCGRPRIGVVESIGIEYRRSKKHIDFYKMANCVKENNRAYQDDLLFIMEVDRSLQNCSKDTQTIIRCGYLDIGDTKWYLEYYTKSAYYRLRKVAIEEFLNCLDL